MMLKECYRWISDNHEGTTPAVAYASENGDICIGEYKQFNNVNNSTQTRKKRTLKQSLRGQYLRVSVNNKSMSVHRLVCIAFHGKPSEGMQVNHKDGNKLNNHKDNLEWVTASENQKHVSDVLGKRCSDNHHNTKYSSETVSKVKEMLDKGFRQCEIARELGVNKYTVSDISRGKARRHG